MRKNRRFLLLVVSAMLLLCTNLLHYNLTTQAQSTISVQIRSNGAETNQSTPFAFLVKNTGTSAVSGLSVRIYFTLDSTNAGSNYVLEKYYDQSGVATVSTPTLASGSVYYFTVNYGAASLSAGASWEFQTALHLANWGTDYDGSNDWYHTGYALNALPAAYANTNNIPAYLNGTRVWGSEPGGAPAPTTAPTTAPTKTNTPGVPTNTPAGATATRTPTQTTSSQVYPAENAVLGGGTVTETTNAGFNGTAYVNFPTTGGTLQFNNVNGGTGGNVTLQFRNALGVTTSRTGLLIINGASQSITFQPTGAWTTWTNFSVTVTLNSGTGNTITLQTNGQDLANIDEMTVAAAGSIPTATRTPTQASAATNTPTRTPTKTNTPSVPTVTPAPAAGWPTAQGDVAVSATISVSGTFDGGMKRYFGTGTLGTSGQSESQSPIFDLANGATIKNVIIGTPAADGIHCAGTCTIQNVWWEDVGEDAATFRGSSSSLTYLVDGGGAKHAADKVFQHNGAGTLTIRNFQVEDFGKLYRSCGNCSTQYQRNVIIQNVTAKAPGLAIAGINTNYGDTARFSMITIIGSTSMDICVKYTGNNTGAEPTKIGTGADGVNCIYSASDITFR